MRAQPLRSTRCELAPPRRLLLLDDHPASRRAEPRAQVPRDCCVLAREPARERVLVTIDAVRSQCEAHRRIVPREHLARRATLCADALVERSLFLRWTRAIARARGPTIGPGHSSSSPSQALHRDTAASRDRCNARDRALRPHDDAETLQPANPRRKHTARGRTTIRSQSVFVLSETRGARRRAVCPPRRSINRGTLDRSSRRSRPR